MPESVVNVTEGSGKLLHTFQRLVGSNTVEDEVVISGEQHVPTYSVGSGQTALTTAASHVVQIMAGATLNVYLREIRVYQVATATAAAISPIALIRLTSAGTGGSVLSPFPHDTNDPGSGATVMQLPTVKGTEVGTYMDIAEAYWLQTLPTAVDFNALRCVWQWNGTREKALRIPAGSANGLALKSLNALAGATAVVTIRYSEANF
jgi:hypothetical protein